MFGWFRKKKKREVLEPFVCPTCGGSLTCYRCKAKEVGVSVGEHPAVRCAACGNVGMRGDSTPFLWFVAYVSAALTLPCNSYLKLLVGHHSS